MIGDFWDWLATLANTAGLAHISLFCLSVVVITMALSIFSFEQRTSVLRSLGHVLLGLWAISRIETKLETMHTTPEHLMLHIALALVCFDTLRRWVKHKRRSRGNFLTQSMGD